jgi:hypothetical protein
MRRLIRGLGHEKPTTRADVSLTASRKMLYPATHALCIAYPTPGGYEYSRQRQLTGNTQPRRQGSGRDGAKRSCKLASCAGGGP